ncbi:putative geranyltranstransferase [Fusobacterium equinum]|uniref:Putative geranyltranstransferase n=1 Tax=Fusobacterium equinum TaxID=134605 RepID=A0A133NB56_9FUSO|nr:farnesyl diphosphate synthase [Fusobacterium equinum]KXA13509.1 putative geranyltranstransferase [Fusobacterium equinum]
MKNYREYFNKRFGEVLTQYNTPVWMAEGMQYACLQGGKRIRPQLLFMTLSLLGKERDLGFPFAAALEMIHSYSLVHDDLPAMDNDDYRRGQLTTHKKFGEANGILIGDALLTNAFSVMIRGSMGKVAAEKILEIVALFSEYAGIDGMIGGQAMDVAYAGKQISYKTLTFIHEHKTGRLLLLPILVACILGDASLEQREALESYGKKIGLAFQIKDDILDVEGSFEELGKAVKSDEKLNKSTYPSIFGLEKSKELLTETLQEARLALEKVFKKEELEEFFELTEFMEKRTK